MERIQDTAKRESLMKAEGERIVTEGSKRNLHLRLLGAIAFQHHCPKYNHLTAKLHRELSDVDFAAYNKERAQIDKMMRDAESHAADDSKKRAETESHNKLDNLIYSTEKTLNDNREKVSAMAGEVETALADAKKALAEGGTEKMNSAFGQLESAMHKMAQLLYQQSAAPEGEATAADDQASAAGASSAGGAGDDNVIDAEYVDVDENK